MLEMNDNANKTVTEAMNNADKVIAEYRKTSRTFERIAWTLCAVAMVVLLCVVVAVFEHVL